MSYPMLAETLQVKRVTASSYAANHRPENVLVDIPEDHASRWTGAYHNVGPLQRQNQWLKLELEAPCIVKTITFGKYQKAHPCNTEQFKVYGSYDDTEEMTELLQSSMNNDDVPQTFALKHYNENGVCFPSRFIKIVPLTPANPTYNMSIWHVALTGIRDPEVVLKAYEEYTNYRETVTMRLVLKHLRRRRYMAYQPLLEETGLSVEHPQVSELYEALIVQGDFSRTETIFSSFSTSGLLDARLEKCRPSTTWRRIRDTNVDGDSPSGRGGHASVIDAERGVVYIFGGWDGQQDLSDLWAYSIHHGRWTTLSLNTEEENGPSPRSCAAAAFDSRTGDIYFLGRYAQRNPSPLSPPTSAVEDSGDRPSSAARVRQRVSAFAQSQSHRSSLPPHITESSSPTSDFYRYSTRGPNEGKWELISRDTTGDGGPELVHDLAMVMDSDSQTLYVFGGEIFNAADTSPRYGGMYSYNVQTGKWSKIFEDPNPDDQARRRHIPSRDGHAMVFDSLMKKVYIIGGRKLDSIFTYDVITGGIAEMTMADRTPRPTHLQMLRATSDDIKREIYVIADLVTGASGSSRSTDGESQGHTTLWVYSMDENTWSPIVEPVRGSSFSGSESPDSSQENSIPKPRVGHSVVLDVGRQVFYAFGGNSGQDARLNDFWSLTLARPGMEDVVRKGKLSIRRQRFVEMCAKGLTIDALQYLQTEISSVVDHGNEEESAAFRGLLTLLLSRPPTPVASVANSNGEQERASTEEVPSHGADVRMGDASHGKDFPTPTLNSEKANGSAPTEALNLHPRLKSVTPTSTDDAEDEIYRQRLAVFDHLLTFVDPNAKQPKADLVDLIRAGTERL